MCSSEVDVEILSVKDLNNAVLKTFIEVYEGLPVLWNPTDPNYINNHKRNAALEELRSIYETIKPGATIVDVRRKINTLRCNYRKELKRIQDSKRSGVATDEVYSPTSWVFYALTFINKYEQPVNFYVRESQNQTSHDDDNDKENESPALLEITPSTSRSSITTPTRPMPKKRRQIGPIAQQNELLQKACTYLEYSNKICDTPNIPTIAKAWGEKLLEMDPQQRALVEKAIGEVIFEGTQGTLHRHSVKINEELLHNI